MRHGVGLQAIKIGLQPVAPLVGDRLLIARMYAPGYSLTPTFGEFGVDVLHVLSPVVVGVL